MATHAHWLVLLERLAHHLDAHKAESVPEQDRKARNKTYLKVLEDVCTVVRDAERHASPDLPQIVEKAHNILNGALQYAYSKDGGVSSLATFAHSDYEPVVEDALENAGSDILDAFLKFYTSLLKPGAPPPKLPAFARVRPWTKSPRPHPLTSRLSRFRGGFAPSASQSTPLAHTIFQARAQLTVDSLPCAPIDMSLSSGGSVLALTSAGGWKGNTPHMQYYLLGEQSSDFLEGVSLDPGLASVASHITTDESHKLVLLADDQRIKSFSFAPNAEMGRVPARLPNVHTMNAAGGFDGPLLVLPNGRIARAGEGRAAIWEIGALETHQDSPGKLIGQGPTLGVGSNTGSRKVEPSPGSQPHSVVAFADDPTFSPAAWHLHAPSGHVLCAEDSEQSGGYACVAVDLEHGGKRVARYLGHGGEVEKITSSGTGGDPNVFVTAGSDGYARMFDVRRPLPVLTFNTGLQREGCVDAVFVHPDGIPTLFTAGDITQQVKLWDVRAEECVYELSTGNNSVGALAWDAARSSLFVATECRYVNRMGLRTGYRRARIPRWATSKAVNQEYKLYKEAAKRGSMSVEEGCGVYGGNDYSDVYDDYLDDGEEGDGGAGAGEESEDEEDVDEAYSADMRWPQKCFHKEDFFGYGYDAGEHVLFRWQFKDAPDITQLPASTTCD